MEERPILQLTHVASLDSPCNRGAGCILGVLPKGRSAGLAKVVEDVLAGLGGLHSRQVVSHRLRRADLSTPLWWLEVLGMGGVFRAVVLDRLRPQVQFFGHGRVIGGVVDFPEQAM